MCDFAKVFCVSARNWRRTVHLLNEDARPQCRKADYRMKTSPRPFTFSTLTRKRFGINVPRLNFRRSAKMSKFTTVRGLSGMPIQFGPSFSLPLCVKSY
jgi:hypothetical protein